MPNACFSYPADVPPGTRNRNAAQAALRDLRKMPYPCFSYPSDVPPGGRTRSAAQPTPPGLRGMVTSCCFSYPPAVPPGIGNRDAAAQPDLRDPRRVVFGTCFS